MTDQEREQLNHLVAYMRTTGDRWRETPMMHHRRLREASQILSVTPSAVSHALNRLRQLIGAGADAVKLEDSSAYAEQIRAIPHAGIPV